MNRFEIEKVDISYFCNTEAHIGEALFKIASERHEVTTIKYAPAGAVLVGISLNDVIEIDLSKYHIPRNTALIGSKLEILKRGKITICLPPLEIPCGQPLYIDKHGKITWKYSIYKIGKTISSQDESGHIKALIKI